MFAQLLSLHAGLLISGPTPPQSSAAVLHSDQLTVRNPAARLTARRGLWEKISALMADLGSGVFTLKVFKQPEELTSGLSGSASSGWLIGFTLRFLDRK